MYVFHEYKQINFCVKCCDAFNITNNYKKKKKTLMKNRKYYILIIFNK